MLRLLGLGPLHKRNERFLQNVFRLTVTKSECPSVKKEFRGLGLIKPFAPTTLFARVHLFIA